jgi:hypothetical protein
MDQQQNRQLRDRIREGMEAVRLCAGAEAARLQQAIDAARNELILVNRPLVKTIAGRFVWLGPYPVPEFDDLFTYGLEGLWRASLRVHTMTHDEVGCNLAVWIRGTMRRRAIQNQPLHKLHRKRKGMVKRYLESYEPTDGPAPDEHAVVDRWEAILGACGDAIDTKIVALRWQNESYSSIARFLRLRSKSTVCERLKNIEKRMETPNDGHEKRHSQCVETPREPRRSRSMTIGQFVENVTEPAPGVATPLSKLRKRYEHQWGPVNRSVFANALGEAGYRLAVTDPSIVLVLDRRLRA